MAEQIDIEDLVDVHEVAKRAGVTYRTVQTWRSRHDDFPDYRKQYLFYWPEVLEWLENTGRGGSIAPRYRRRQS